MAVMCIHYIQVVCVCVCVCVCVYLPCVVVTSTFVVVGVVGGSVGSLCTMVWCTYVCVCV